MSSERGIELIKITEHKGQQAVSARELHAFLDSKQQFADWVKARIEKYGFNEDQDFTIHKVMNGKYWQIEYALTIDTAKEIAMVEGNEKGKQARRYFIECEKKLKESVSFKLPQSYSEALRMLADETEAMPKIFIISCQTEEVRSQSQK